MSGRKPLCRSPFLFHITEYATIAHTPDKIPGASEIPGTAGPRPPRRCSRAQLWAFVSVGSGRNSRITTGGEGALRA